MVPSGNVLKRAVADPAGRVAFWTHAGLRDLAFRVHGISQLIPVAQAAAHDSGSLPEALLHRPVLDPQTRPATFAAAR
jgi:hypothetical protein